MAAVAVAVVCYETRDLLAEALDALAAAGDAEVWVVDNGSSDGSAAMVRERFGAVRLIDAGEILGFGAAVNRVAAATATPWIAAMNADVRVAPDTLARLLEAGARHAEAGVLAPRLVTPDGRWQHTVHPFPTLPVAAAFHLGGRRALG